jgi:hypothetical protein
MNSKRKSVRDILIDASRDMQDLLQQGNKAKEWSDRIDEALSQLAEVVVKCDIEAVCEQVHKAYCKYHLEHKGVEYWTKGDYSKLNEDGKEYDRRTVRAVLDHIADMVEGEGKK